MPITIEKTIPLPTRATHKHRDDKYPELRQLEVGDSFMVRIATSTLASHGRRVAKDTGRKFLVRAVLDSAGAEQGARVWRKS